MNPVSWMPLLISALLAGAALGQPRSSLRSAVPVLAVVPPGTSGSLILMLCADTSCQTAASTNEISVLPSRFPLPIVGCTLITDQPQTTTLLIGCFDSQSGESTTDCQANLAIAPVSFSGGHDHDDSTRPAGDLDVSSGTTGTSGLEVTYTAPSVSGQVTLSLSGTQSDGTPLLPSSATIDVKVSGLAAMTEAPQYYGLVGATPIHLNNHFSLPYISSALVTIAEDFATAFPGFTLSYNDASLVEGGVFDLDQDWAPPHCGHSSLGGATNNVDVALVDTSMQARLEKIILKYGGRVCVKHSNHWHLCF